MPEFHEPLMRREDIAATSRPFAEARPLAGPPYRDPKIFDAEVDTIFRRMWLCATHQDALSGAGDFVTREVGGESVIIVRAQDGGIGAFHNVCRHRGTRLVDDNAGTGLDCIRCPYHAWTYGLDGALVGAPHMNTVAGFDRSEYPLTPISCSTWEGFVFVNFDVDAPPLSEYLAGFPDVSRFDMASMRLGAVHEYVLEANWKLVCENYGECYHCPTNHPQITPVSDFRSGGSSFDGDAFCGGPMRLNDGCVTMTETGQTTREPLSGLAGDDLRLVHYFNIYPAFLLSLHPDYVLTHTLWPIAADRSLIRCEWLFAADAVERDDFDPADAVDFWHLTNQQDWALCERAQKGVQSRGYRPGRYHGLEETIYFFDNWYLRAMKEVFPGISKRYDAIVIGAGHNGLVCAAYLAKAGKSVLVVERRHLVGGATVTEEVFPGFKFSVCSYVVSLMRPRIISELDLPRFGFELLPLDGTLTPLPDGDHMMRWHDAEETRRELAKFSAADAEAYQQFGKLMYHLAMTVRPMLSSSAPDPASLSPSSLSALAGVARTFGRGKAYLYDLAKLMTMSSADFVEDWFESEPLRGTLSSSGIIGTFLGPRSPGSAYVMLHHYMGEIDGQFRAWGLPRGGMGAVAESIAGAARSFGAEIRLEAPIDHVIVERGAAKGVVLDSGEEIRADTVVSSLDPKRTFLQMVGAEHLDDEFVTQIERFKIRGSSGKVNLALDTLPHLTCLDGIESRTGFARESYLRGAISISPSVDYLERAYQDAKYGRFSARPYMDIVLPTLADPSMAPPGKHVMSIFVQYAPYALAEGDWEQQREAFGDAVIDTLSEYMPNLKEIILHRQVVTPWDLEQRFGLTQGNIFHGELSLEQLFFMRPVAGWADHRTPIGGYYQCGSGTHPGGGVMGAPGRLAARKILGESSR